MEADTLASMHCPYCLSEATRVVDSRPADQGTSIRRRRECEACSQRFTTYERAEPQLIVLKRSGAREPFEGGKLRRGLENALADRPLAMDALDEIVSAISRDLLTQGPVVESDLIGRAVLQRLKGVDEVAYLRFASVYKDFQGASDFEREMAELDAD